MADQTILKDISRNELSKQKESSTTLAGKVTPNSSQKITLDKTKGEVERVSVKEGDKVSVGQELFAYKDSEGDSSLKEAELAVAEKQKTLENAQSTSTMEWAVYNNMKKNATTEQQAELYQQQMKAQMATNEIDAAEIGLSVAQASYETSKLKADDRIIRSKINGSVKKIDTDQLENNKDSSDSVMELIDDSTLFVNGNISEFDVEKIELGQKVEIIDRKNTNNTWTGEVTKVAHLAAEGNQESDKKEAENPNLSKYPYTIKIEGDQDKPIIGAHVYVKLSTTSDPNLISVPTDYIFTDKDQKDESISNSYVWKVVNKKITKQKITIEPQKNDSGTVTVIEGLTKEDRIVLPQGNLKEGMEIGKSTDAN